MLIHPKILRLARLGLEISQEELGKAAGLTGRTVRNVEASELGTALRAHFAVRSALEGLGVIFFETDGVGGPGFRLPIGYPKSGKSSKNPDVKIASEE